MCQVIWQTFFNLSNQNWTLHSCYSLCNFTIYYCFTVGPRPGTRALRQSCLLLRTAATGWQSFVEPCVRHRGPLVCLFFVLLLRFLSTRARKMSGHGRWVRCVLHVFAKSRVWKVEPLRPSWGGQEWPAALRVTLVLTVSFRILDARIYLFIFFLMYFKDGCTIYFSTPATIWLEIVVHEEFKAKYAASVVLISASHTLIGY